MVTNLLEIHSGQQTAVEAVTCSLRKTYLKFLVYIVALIQTRFSEDQVPAYSLNHLRF